MDGFSLENHRLLVNLSPLNIPAMCYRGFYYCENFSVTCLVTDIPSGSSERYSRGRLSPNPLLVDMRSSLARDELLPPTKEELGLLSGGHFDPPSLGSMRGGTLGGLSMRDREPSLLDQVMSDRRRGDWRLDDEPLVMSRRQDGISRQPEDIPREQSEVSKQHGEAGEGSGRRIFLRNVRFS